MQKFHQSGQSQQFGQQQLFVDLEGTGQGVRCLQLLLSGPDAACGGGLFRHSEEIAALVPLDVGENVLGRRQGREMYPCAVQPQKTPPKARRITPVTVALVLNEGRVLLQQRPAKGLLAGLWQPVLWIFRLVNQMAKSEGVNEQLKVSNAMLWIQKMNNIRNKASEIINAEVIFPD